MNIRMHFALNRFFNIFRLIAPLLACAVLASASPYVIGAFVLAYFVPPLLTWLMPVECDSFGCTGYMKYSTERLSFWFVNDLYTCDTCGRVLQEKIFNPDIEVTVEFG